MNDEKSLEEDDQIPSWQKIGEHFNDYYGILIPSGPLLEHTPIKVAKYKRILCWIGLHRWGFAGISYTGPSTPRTCKWCNKMKWFKKIRSWKWLDKVLRPLCIIGLHRWKKQFGYRSYQLVPGRRVINQSSSMRCSRCAKRKEVKMPDVIKHYPDISD